MQSASAIPDIFGLQKLFNKNVIDFFSFEKEKKIDSKFNLSLNLGAIFIFYTQP